MLLDPESNKQHDYTKKFEKRCKNREYGFRAQGQV